MGDSGRVAFRISVRRLVKADGTFVGQRSELPKDGSDTTLYAVWLNDSAVSEVTYDGEGHAYHAYETGEGVTVAFDVQYYVNGAWTSEEPVNAGKYNVKVLDSKTGQELMQVENGLQIIKRNITITVPDAQSQYGDADAELVFELAEGSALGQGDELSDLNIELSRRAGTAVGDYTIFTAYDNNNYTITFDTGVYRIVPREITIDIGDVEQAYGKTIQTPAQWKLADGFEMAYGESTDVLKVTLAKEGGADAKEVAEYAITGSWTNGNYNVTFNNGTYRITPKNVTVVIKDRQSVYGELLADLNNQSASWELQYGSAMAWGEPSSALNVTLTKAEGENVGEYAITGEWNNKNYTVKFVDGKYTITKANFDVPVSPYNGIFDGQAHGVEVVLGDIADAKVQYSTDGRSWQDEAIVFTNVTDKSLVYVRVIRDNYFDYISSATVTITPKEVSVEWTFEGTTSSDYTWVYDNTLKVPGATVSSGIDGIELALTVTGGQVNASDEAYYATASLATPNANFVLLNTEHEFYIVRAKIGADVAQPDLDAQIYTSGKLPELTLRGASSQLGTIAWDDYVLRADQKTYTWTFTPNDARNYETETGSFTFNNIVEVAVDRIEVNADGAVKNYVYGDKMNREGIVVTVIYNDGATSEVSGFTFRYENGGEFFFAGESVVTVVVTTGADQEYTAEISGITVEKKTVETPVTRPLTYNTEYQQVQFVPGTDTSLFDTDSDDMKIDAGSYTATLTLKDFDNYKWAGSDTASLEVNWTIGKLTAEIVPEVDNGKTIYTDDDALPELTLPGAFAGIGTIEWDAYIISATQREYGWTFTPNAENEKNYNKVTGVVVFNDIRVRQIEEIESTNVIEVCSGKCTAIFAETSKMQTLLALQERLFLKKIKVLPARQRQIFLMPAIWRRVCINILSKKLSPTAMF